MAISFVGSSNTTYASRTNTTISNTLSAGSITDGDVLLFTLFTGAASEAPDPTAPGGLTAIGTALDVTDGGSFNGENRAWIKVASGESGSYAFTHSSASSQGVLTVWRGCDTTTPQDATATQNSANTGTDATYNGLTTVTNNAWIVALGQNWGYSGFSPPSGMTERLDVVLHYVASEARATAGATGNRTHTINGAGNVPWTARLVALRPAGAGAFSLAADAGAYTWTGTAASPLYGRLTGATAGSYAWTGATAGTLYGRNVAATAGSFSWAGVDAGLSITAKVTAAAAGAYTWTGTAAGLLYGRTAVADAGSFSWAGTAAGTLLGYQVAGAAGSFAWTGVDAGLQITARQVDAGAGLYAWTGATAATFYGRMVSAAAGAYAWTGVDATLTYTGVGALAVAADPGAFAWDGPDAGLLGGYRVTAEAGSYEWTGADAGLTYATAPEPEEETPIARPDLGGGPGGRGFARRLRRQASLAQARMFAQWDEGPATFGPNVPPRTAEIVLPVQPPVVASKETIAKLVDALVAKAMPPAKVIAKPDPFVEIDNEFLMFIAEMD